MTEPGHRRRLDDWGHDTLPFLVILYLVIQLIGIFVVASTLSLLHQEIDSLDSEHQAMKQNMYSVTQRCENIYRSRAMEIQ